MRSRHGVRDRSPLTPRGSTRQQVKPLKAVAQLPAPAPSVTEQAAAGKYFHARTAVALHPKELAGELCVDSDDEEDEQHWEVRRVLHGSCARRGEASDGGCDTFTRADQVPARD